MGLNKIKKRFSYLFISIKDKLYGTNKSFDTAQVNNLVLIVGPYRNLTSYLTSILSLHSNCKVLNHAGIRVFRNKKTNFLKDYSHSKYLQFLRFFDYASEKGYKGMLGGNISHSHAFESNTELSKRFKETLKSKTKPHCFIWKESHMVTERLMNGVTELEEILEKNPAIKFLMPVRKPLDCAKSNIKTGKNRFFKHVPSDDVFDVSKAIFTQQLFFLKIQSKYPDRVFFLFENEINSEGIENMCAFLNIEFDEKWVEIVLSQHTIKSGYDHPYETIEKTRKLVDTLFADYDSFREKLLSLI